MSTNGTATRPGGRATEHAAQRTCQTVSRGPPIDRATRWGRGRCRRWLDRRRGEARNRWSLGLGRHRLCRLGQLGQRMRRQGRRRSAQARELLAVGVNWNFAPVVDVNNNPDNPIIGVRSFGEDPRLVARLGSAAMHGYQVTGLLACAKHFPGHGDTSVDSHLALPTIEMFFLFRR